MIEWNIAVCDDEANELQNIIDHVRTYNKTWVPLVFSSAKALLAASESTHFDIILLDIEMSAPTGFEAAKRLIATQSPAPLIIFITKSSAYTTRGYGVAFRYLIKPICWDDFSHAMDSAVDELRANRFSFEYSNGIFSLPIQSIYYIESFAHVAVIHTADEEFRIRATLSDLQQKLPLSRFVTPHKSYLVNMAHINYVLTEDIVLTSGVHIPLSRRKRQEFTATFCRYLGR